MQKMSKTKISKVLAFLVALATQFTAVASALSTLPSQQKQYVEQYVKAINNNDLIVLQAITHRAFLNCINDENNDYYQHIFTQSLKRSIPSDYKVVFEVLSAEEVNREVVGASNLGFSYPVAPTHQVQIDYNKTEYSSVGIVRKLVLENGQYYEVSGCPDTYLLERFRALELKKKAEQQKAKQLFQKISPALLSELTVLLKQGQKIQAWKLYNEATGHSMGMAKSVLSNIDLSNN